MARIVIVLEDTKDGELDVKFTADSPLPDSFESYTLAQILAGQLHDLIEKLFAEQAPDV
jgi:hypothetical protein